MSIINLHPFNVIIHTLAKRIDDGDKSLGDVGIAARIDRQLIIAAMEVGRQFDRSSALILFKTNYDTSRQTMRVAQFGIGYLGISVRHADLHRLTSKIPGAIGLDTNGR